MSIRQCIFPDKLKTADIIPCHKKDDTSNKRNYRPISLLPTISKDRKLNFDSHVKNICKKENQKSRALIRILLLLL